MHNAAARASGGGYMGNSKDKVSEMPPAEQAGIGIAVSIVVVFIAWAGFRLGVASGTAQAHADTSVVTENSGLGFANLIVQQVIAASGVAVIAINLLGVWLLFRTLRSTQDAANIAYETLRETESTTKAATESARITKEIGEQQNRAQVGLTGLRLTFAEVVPIKNMGDPADIRGALVPKLEITVENFGNTAARNFCWLPALSYLPMPAGPERWSTLFSVAPSETSIPDAQELYPRQRKIFQTSYEFSLSEIEGAALKNINTDIRKCLIIKILIQIFYVDVFQVHHYNDFQFMGTISADALEGWVPVQQISIFPNHWPQPISHDGQEKRPPIGGR